MEARRWMCFALMLFEVSFLEGQKFKAELESENQFKQSRAKRNVACGEALTGTKGTFSLSVDDCTYDNITYPCYSKNLQCQWTIESTPGHIFMLKADDFYLEESNDCQFDYLEIVEDDGRASKRCGWNPVFYISTTDKLTINFKSDDTYEGSGFKFEYITYSPDMTTHCNTSIVGGPDGKIYNDDSADTSCFYLIQAGANKVVKLELTMIQFGSNKCEEESLIIRQASAPERKTEVRVCSYNTTGLLSEEHNAVLIEYRNVIGSEGERFEIKYSFVNEPAPPVPLPPSPVGGDPDCSGLFTEEIDWVWKSPSYEASRHCIVVIRNRQLEGGVIQVTFNNFHLEDMADCRYDSFQVKSGERNESQSLGGPYCGKSLKGKTIVSYGNTLRMEFKTDESLSWFGVEAHIKIVPRRACDVCQTGVCVTKGYEKLCMKGKECDDNSCLNGGTCAEIKGKKTCYCPEGFSGKSCSQGKTTGVQLLNPPGNKKVKKGAEVFEECSAVNALSYKWLFNGQPVPEYRSKNKFGAYANGILQIDDITEDQEGLYTCIALTENGNAEHTFEITVLEDCNVEFKDRPDKLLNKRVGDSVMLPCSAMHGKKITWKKADSVNGPFRNVDVKDTSKYSETKRTVNNIVSNYLRIKNAQKEDEGIYRCEVENQRGCYSNREAKLTILSTTYIHKFCGISRHDENVQGLIFKGKDARPGEIPWFVTLRKNKEDGSSVAFCGGTLITNSHVLTAAHCIEKDFSPASVELLFGSTNCSSSQTKRKIKSFKTHPAFNKTAPFDSDIAIIELNSPVEFGRDIRAICLESESNAESMFFSKTSRLATKSGAVAGCGKKHHKYGGSGTLQVVNLPYVPFDECLEEVEDWNEKKQKSKQIALTDKMICAGYTDKTKADSCQGDSGGPLTMYHSGQWYLTGIVSFGMECGKSNLFGFYAKVPKFVEWIDQETKFSSLDCTHCDWALE